jgi:hypothetical protein
MKIAPQCKGVRPAILLNNAHWKVLLSQFRPKAVVMADGCYARKEIAYATPPEAHFSWDAFVLRYSTRASCVYILPPLDIIPIRWIAKLRVKGVLQMIMRVDQTWHEQVTVQINIDRLT